MRFVARRSAGGPVVAYAFVSSNPVKYSLDGCEVLVVDEFAAGDDELKADGPSRPIPPRSAPSLAPISLSVARRSLSGGRSAFTHLIGFAVREHLSHSRAAASNAEAKDSIAAPKPKGHMPVTPAPEPVLN